MNKRETKYQILDHEPKISLKYIIKHLLNYPIGLIYRAILNCAHTRHYTKRKYTCCVCAIFRDEANYLKEWIEFHLLIGIEHFYLYNNFSVDNYLEVLEPYIQRGIVTLVDWPFERQQMKAYAHCVDTFKSETQWIGFIDLDEFIVPNKHESIQEFLAEFTNRPNVIINWRYFGSGGIVSRNPKGLVSEDFVVAWKKYSDIGKMFFNTDYDYWADSNQYMHYRWAKYKNIKLPPVNVFNKPLIWDINPIHTDEMPIQINHYVVKSYREYIDKKARRGGGIHKPMKGFHDDEYFWDHEFFCQSVDYHIFRYMTRLKLNMNEETIVTPRQD